MRARDSHKRPSHKQTSGFPSLAAQPHTDALAPQQVWFTFRSDAAPDAIAAAMDELRKLPALIPEIVSLSCGANFTTRTPHTHGLLVILTDKEGACQ